MKKFILNSLLITLLLTLCISCGGGNSMQIDKSLEWFLKQHKSLKKDYYIGKFGIDKHPSGWDHGAYLRAYIEMYEKTADIRVLRALNELLKIVADGNDIITKRADDRTKTILPGWGTREYSYGKDGKSRYSDMLTNALYAYPLAAFARIVKEDKKLQKEFGKDANRYYKMVADLYNAHKPFKEAKDSPYKDKTIGLAFVYPKNWYDGEDNYSNIEAPINWTVIIAEPLTEMYRAAKADSNKSKEAKKYKDILIKVANYTWHNIKIKSKKGKKYLFWHYWPKDINIEQRERPEDLTHGAKMGEFVHSLLNSNIKTQWNKTKATYLANSLTVGAKIDDVVFANYIDGSGGVYKNYISSLRDWLVLEEYSKTSNTAISSLLLKGMKQRGENIKDNLALFAKFICFAK